MTQTEKGRCALRHSVLLLLCSALAAGFLFDAGEIAGLRDLGGIELAVLILGGITVIFKLPV